MTDINTWANTVQYLHQLPRCWESVIPQQISGRFEVRGEEDGKGTVDPHFSEILLKLKIRLSRNPWSSARKSAKIFRTEPTHWYRPGTNWQLCWKGPEVTLDANTRMSQKYFFVVNEANHTLGCTRKNTAIIRWRDVMIPSCLVLVTPHQECCAGFGPPSSCGLLRNWGQFSNTEDLFQAEVQKDFSLPGDACLANKDSLGALSEQWCCGWTPASN